HPLRLRRAAGVRRADRGIVLADVGALGAVRGEDRRGCRPVRRDVHVAVRKAGRGRMSRRAIVQSPEHVLIELVPAGLGARLAAFLLDMALIAGILQLIALVAVALPQALRDIAVVTASFVVIWGYNTFFEVRWNGQTPGKRILR